jgi:hypothetical protein
MGLQKYRADRAEPAQPNGAIAWCTHWMGGPSLALVRNCPTPFGPRTVYVRGEADTFFSIPAACTFRGRTIQGYLTTDDTGWTFRPYLYGDTVYPVVQ